MLNRFRLILVIGGLITLCVSIGLISFLYQPTELLQTQATLAPTLFISP